MQDASPPRRIPAVQQATRGRPASPRRTNNVTTTLRDGPSKSPSATPIGAANQRKSHSCAEAARWLPAEKVYIPCEMWCRLFVVLWTGVVHSQQAAFAVAKPAQAAMSLGVRVPWRRPSRRSSMTRHRRGRDRESPRRWRGVSAPRHLAEPAVAAAGSLSCVANRQYYKEAADHQ